MGAGGSGGHWNSTWACGRGWHVVGIVEGCHKLGPPSWGTRTKINSGKVRIHKDLPLAEVLHPAPYTPWFHISGVNRVWGTGPAEFGSFPLSSRLCYMSPRLRVEGNLLVRKRYGGKQKKGPLIFLEAVNPICKPFLNKYKLCLLLSLPHSTLSSCSFHRAQVEEDSFYFLAQWAKHRQVPSFSSHPVCLSRASEHLKEEPGSGQKPCTTC